jgi:hypothetical protein
MRARLLAPENRKWLTLAAVTFGLFMIMLDNTIVNVALSSTPRWAVRGALPLPGSALLGSQAI